MGDNSVHNLPVEELNADGSIKTLLNPNVAGDNIFAEDEGANQETVSGGDRNKAWVR